MAASKPTSWLSERSDFLSHLTIIWGPYQAGWTVFLSTVKLSPHSLTPGLVVIGIRSLAGFSKPESPLVQSCLYHQSKSPEASPKAISERTSYHGI